jgi:hypothetical protein
MPDMCVLASTWPQESSKMSPGFNGVRHEGKGGRTEALLVVRNDAVSKSGSIGWCFRRFALWAIRHR